MRGFQLRYAGLVAGALLVLLLFTGFHAMFAIQQILPSDVALNVRPLLEQSTYRVFFVGVLYIAVVTLAAIFLSHRALGPVGRLEDEVREMAESGGFNGELKVREGDGLEDLVVAINQLLRGKRERK